MYLFTNLDIYFDILINAKILINVRGLGRLAILQVLQLNNNYFWRQNSKSDFSTFFFQVFFALVLVAAAHAAPQLQQLDLVDNEPEPFNVSSCKNSKNGGKI